MPTPRPDRQISWRTRPLLLAAGLMAAGILLEHHLGAGSPVWWTIAIILAMVAASAIAWLPQRRLVTLRPLALTACVAVAVMSLGGQRQALWLLSGAAPVAELAAEVDALEHAFPLLIAGRVDGSATRTEARLRFALEVDSAGFERLMPVSGRVEVTIWRPREYGAAAPAGPPPAWPDLQPGHLVQVEGILRPLPGRRNPADFDYGAYLKRQGVHAIVSGADTSAVEIIGYRPTWPERAVTRARRHVRAAMQAHVHDENARAVLQALLLADRSGIDPQIRQGFARTGLAHLLAVSGLHVFLVGMVLYGLLKPLLHRFAWPWRRVELTRAAATITLLIAYVAVVGGPASAVRALVMAIAFIGGRAFERPSNALNSLGAAALVLLLVRPAALMDVGFQLSFAAVGALVLLMPQLEQAAPSRLYDGGITRYFTRLVLASVAATLGTMPVLLAHFGLFPIAGVVLNVVAIPATGLALGGGLMAVAFHGWLPPLAVAAGASADLFARAVLTTGLRGEQWLGWTAVGAHVTDTFVLLALALAVLAIAFAARPRLRWRTTIAACACLCVAVWLPLLRGESRPVLDILFFDVGQGDAVLVRLPGGRTLLVDAGPADPFGDAATRTILPHLDRYRIRRLDAVVITHPHADHLGGLPTLLESVPVGIVYDNGQEYDSDLFRHTVALSRELGVPVRSLGSGHRVLLDQDVRIHVLHPGPEPDAHANDASVVVHMTYGEVTFILAGDIEEAAETTVAMRYGSDLCAALVKVPHHGSRTSSTAPFVDSVTGCGRTRYAVVPVARRNRYNLPNDEALERWAGAGATVLQTAEEGAVWLRSDGRRIWRHHWR